MRATAVFSKVERQGYPYFRLILGMVGHQFEVRPEHAHNRVAHIMPRNDAADDAGFATQALLPDGVAQDRHAILARLVFLVEEVTTEFHSSVQEPEEVS